MENIEKSSEYKKETPPILKSRPRISIPRSTGGIMPCRHREIYSGTGGIMPCRDTEYNFPDFEDSVLGKILENAPESVKEKAKQITEPVDYTGFHGLFETASE